MVLCGSSFFLFIFFNNILGSLIKSKVCIKKTNLVTLKTMVFFYSVNLLLKETATTKPMFLPINDFELMINVGKEQLKNGTLDINRIKKATLGYPIIYYQKGNNKIILDGMHRLMKSYLYYHDKRNVVYPNIPCVKITRDKLKKCEIKKPSTESHKEMDNLNYELENQITSLEMLIDTVEIMDDNITTDYTDTEKKLINQNIGNALDAINYKDKLITVESNSFTVSKEGILDAITYGVSRIGKRIAATIKDDIDRLEYFLTFCELQSNLLNELRYKIDGIPNGHHRISIPTTKYVRYGADQYIDSLSSYLNAYDEVIKVMNEVNMELGVTLKDDFAQSLKTLISPITGYDKEYMVMYKRLESLIITIRNATQAKSYNSDEEYHEFRSKTYLGLSHFEFKTPQEKYIKPQDVDVARRNHKHFYAALWRENKFETDLTNRNVEWEDINKEDIMRLVDITQSAISKYDKLSDVKSKLSVYGAGMVFGDAIVSAVLPIYWWKALLGNYRIMVRTSTILANMTAGCFNFTRGNIDKCLQIIEKATEIKSNIDND